MRTFQPNIFVSLKGYSKDKFLKDIIAGIIVAIIALPLSIALAIASGVGPEIGLYTAIVAGFLISLLGGSPVQIAGPTAAFASIVAGIVATKGMNGLIIATIMAGIVLVVMGILRLGNLIKYIPHSITVGFTAGIAVTIAIGQVKDFFGLTFKTAPIETVEKLEAIFASLKTFNLWGVLVGVFALAILIFLPKVFPRIPASLVAVIFCAALVKLANLPVNTIGVLYPNITSAAPKFSIPELSADTVVSVIPDAVTIAVLAAVESLLSCVVADGMVGSKHNSNTELIAQGVGNVGSALLGGIPATGAIARTAANIKNGGRTPVAGMTHAVVLFVVLILVMPYAKLIPMPAIAAILFVVAFNMSEYKKFIDIFKTRSKVNILVLVLTFVLTVIFDLVVAIAAGLVIHYAIVLIVKISHKELVKKS